MVEIQLIIFIKWSHLQLFITYLLLNFRIIMNIGSYFTHLLTLLLFSLQLNAHNTVVPYNFGKADTATSNSLERSISNLLNKKTDSAFALSNQVIPWAKQNRQTHLLARAYSAQGRYHYGKGQYHQAINCFFQSLKSAIESKDKKQESSAYNNIGLTYYDLSDYSRATEYFLNNLKIKKELRDQRGISNAYNNLGLVCFKEGNFHASIDYYEKSLKYSEAIGDKRLIGDVYNNLGIVCLEQNETNQALNYFLKSLYIKEGLDDKKGLGGAYNNIGLVYFEMANYYKALEFHFKNLNQAKSSANQQDLAECYNGIAQVFIKLYTDYSNMPATKKDSLSKVLPMVNGLKKFQTIQFLDSALVLLKKAHQINKQLANTSHVLTTMNELGNVYLLKPDYPTALDYFNQSQAIAAKIHAQKEYTDAAKGLYQIHKSLGNAAEALKWHENYIKGRDSLNSQSNVKASLRRQLNDEYEKKNTLLRLEDEKNALKDADRLKQEKLIVVGVLIGLLLTVAFSVFLYRRYAIIQRQKKLIESKNREIVDSIHYAKRIQDALLPDQGITGKSIPDSFILFLPKDIVSGDFYWMTQKDGFLYIAAADCTGHGVPGGFMSMLGIAFLNEITAATQQLTAAEILDHLGSKVIQQLGQTGRQGEARDGMDISLLRLNTSTRELNWAGANNSMYIVQEGDLEELKPDKQPIGFNYTQKPFTNHFKVLKSPAMLYLLTDGYADQFGGPKAKKFKYKPLEELLVSIASQPVEQQKEQLIQAHLSWKGNQEQVDDVCIIGIKFT